MLLAHSASRRIWPRRVTTRSSSAPALEQHGRDGTPNRSMPGRLKLAGTAHDSTINMAGAMGRKGLRGAARCLSQKNAPSLASGDKQRKVIVEGIWPPPIVLYLCTVLEAVSRQHRSVLGSIIYLARTTGLDRLGRLRAAEWSPAVAMRRSAVQRRGTLVVG